MRLQSFDPSARALRGSLEVLSPSEGKQGWVEVSRWGMLAETQAGIIPAFPYRVNGSAKLNAGGLGKKPGNNRGLVDCERT